MFKNYLIASLRNFTRRKLYRFINTRWFTMMRNLILQCLVAFLAAFSCASAAVADETARMDETKQYVAVDSSRRLFMDCMGQGEPTIIFDAGYGSVSSDWRAVEAILAPHNKVCTYDRAGMGHSDGQSRPTTPSNVVDDLHRLIQNSHMKTPIVLVGHSRGGLYDTLYALTYRSELAAMVLVDPVVAQNNSQMLAISPSERAFLNSGNLEQTADLVRCEGLAKAHEVTAADPHGCYSFSSLDTPATRADAIYQGAKPEHYQALISEQEAALAGVDTAKIIGAERKNAHPFGNLPLIVLTSSKPRQIGGPNAADDGAVDKIWKDDHELLANESLAGRSLIVPNSSHLIALDHPQSVADAVNTVLQECCRVK